MYVHHTARVQIYELFGNQQRKKRKNLHDKEKSRNFATINIKSFGRKRYIVGRKVKSLFSRAIKVLLPLLLGGAILYWMYRDFDFQRVRHVLLHEMSWTWMLLSLPFCVLAQTIRGWRWMQTLEPVGERPRTEVAVCSIFVSYAVSLVVPRIGEFTRCGILKRWDGVSFPKALGTVVTERVVDSLIIMLVTALAIAFEMSIFGTFFDKTGTSLDVIVSGFSAAGWGVTAICAVAVAVLMYFLLRRLSICNKVKATLHSMWEGIVSLRRVRRIPLFIAFSVGIWLSYFMHYYLTFYCFPFTEGLGLGCGLVTFLVGSIAVVVPTPNGAGPWHFAVKTMLLLYGVADEQALYFVLIVHAVQTMFVVLLGVYGWVRLSYIDIANENGHNT